MKKTYASFPQNPFNTWRLALIAIPILMIVFKILAFSTIFSFLLSFLIGISISVVFTLISYTKITYSNNQLFLQNLSLTQTLNSISSIETWWNYELGLSTEEFVETGD